LWQTVLFAKARFRYDGLWVDENWPNMTVKVKNIFHDLAELSDQEELSILFQKPCATIERIVSQSHSSPPGFWYDQDEDEWAIVLRGDATLEFERGDFVRMKEGDYVTIPRHVKHRVHQTGPETIWLAVRIR
jgi:cupin 2 domain-containing protein